MAVVEIAKIQVRRGQENLTGVPELAPGEFAWAEDTQNLYIGKSVSEGANNNNNARVLTDKDLDNIFRLAQSGVLAVNPDTGYRYRNDVSTSTLFSSTGTYAHKLDNWVSITDFSPVWPPVNNEITSAINNAIAGSQLAGVGPYNIKIPQGSFVISGPVQLPPYTTLMGEGAGKTTLTNSSGEPMFVTVDSSNNDFNNDSTGTNEIKLSGFTLVGTSTSVLVSLDNVKDAEITDIEFGDPTASDVSDSVGLRLRAYTSGDDVSMANNANIKIDNCKFNGLDRAVYQTTGTTNRFYVQNSVISNVNRGVEMWSSMNEAGPVNGVIENNTFYRVAEEAIYIGTTTYTTSSYVVSTNNTFRNVGNNLGNADTQITPVITFNTLGNRSVDDYYDRRVHPLSTTSINYPIVAGPATVNDSINYTATTNGTTSTVANIALSGREQLLSINYTMTDIDNVIFTRTGTLTMNVTADTGTTAFASVADYYNYAEAIADSSQYVAFSTDYTSNTASNYVSLVCYNYLDMAPGVDSTNTNINLLITYQINQLQ
jgi:hypothetical protein